MVIFAIQDRFEIMNGAVVELVYTADSKSAVRRACGFESRPRYQIV